MDEPAAQPHASFEGDDRYQVLETLGAGSFGVVYRVLDRRWGQELALKTIRSPSPEFRQWLKAEYRSLRDIVHPNLVRLHDLYVDGARCFFTMDVVPNAASFNRRFRVVRDAPLVEQRAAIRRVCRGAAQLCDALHAVHELGKCHRDVKPSNVLVTASDHVVLVDFGLVGPVDRDRALDTARGAVQGTFPYLAPEQLAEPRPLPSSDWYSVGLLLYEALTGVLPFADDPFRLAGASRRGPTPLARFMPAIPPALDDLVSSLLEPDPSRRATGAVVLAALRELGDESRSHSSEWAWRTAAEPVFVAREEELSRLREAYARADAGSLAIVDVVGPSGIGKTALVQRFLRELKQRSTPPLVLQARCHPQESIPYKAFDAVVDDLARYWLGLGPDEAATLCPEEGAGPLTLLFPELRRVPVLDVPTGEMLRRGDARALRQTAFEALRVVLTKVRERVPLVLWVDDTQWADVDSGALMEAVFGGEDRPALLLLVTRRPVDGAGVSSMAEAIGRVDRGRARTVIALEPLEPSHARSLVSAITKDAGAAAADSITTILEEAAGVPYLLAELAHFAAAHAGRPLGTTAGSLMSERIDALSMPDRRLVELAALCGTPQPPAVLLAAAECGDRSRIRDLCVLRLLRWTGDAEEETLQIYHDRLREFVVEGLPPVLSVEHNRALVVAMEAASSSDDEQMMEHALAAGDRDRTRRHALAAAERADAALAFEQAARLYRLALDHTALDAPRATLHERLAEAMANAGHSKVAAPEFERAFAALDEERSLDVRRRGFLRRRAGEQYLKAGHYDDGLRLMAAFLAEAGVRLPKPGNGALAVSFGRRLRLYLRGFEYRTCPPEDIAPEVVSHLDDLWAATTALSMMDPVQADGVGLLHCLEALRAGHAAHIARSLGYEAAFAALIGGGFLRRRAQDLLRRNREALAHASSPYEHAFLRLCEGTSAFFHSRWQDTVDACDEAALEFRSECRGAEYEAAVAVVFSLQALGQAGRVSELVARIPAAIREADARGDLFAANNYRAGFHALGRIAAGQVDEVRADLERVVETWKPGFYQMHAYHRVFAEVAAELYVGNPASAVARVENDWPLLARGLFLRMELPAVELRWTRARATLAMARQTTGDRRRTLLAKTKRLARAVARATIAASRPHAALLRAGVAAVEERPDHVVEALRHALEGYSTADMAIHREVVRWALGCLVGGDEGRALREGTEAWMTTEGVPDMAPLVAAMAPGLTIDGSGRGGVGA